MFAQFIRSFMVTTTIWNSVCVLLGAKCCTQFTSIYILLYSNMLKLLSLWVEPFLCDCTLSRMMVIEACHINFVDVYIRICLEFAYKLGKTWNVYSKPCKSLKFVNLMFPDSLFKMSFRKIINLHLCHIYIITMIWSKIDMQIHYFYLKITWKIHEILCHRRIENPDVEHREVFFYLKESSSSS